MNNPRQSILSNAQLALGAIDCGIVFDPADAATALAVALGYLVGTYKLDIDSVRDVVCHAAAAATLDCSANAASNGSN